MFTLQLFMLMAMVMVTLAASKPKNSIKQNYGCGVAPIILLKKQSKGHRILGENYATFAEFPWQVYIGIENKSEPLALLCGGTLVSEKFVLTAAHCAPIPGFTQVIILGEFDTSKKNEPLLSERRTTKKWIQHEDYTYKEDKEGYILRMENDIALIEMDKPVKFRAHIVPICLPDENDDFTGQMGTLAGWGSTTDNGPVSKVLKKVDLPVLAVDNSTKYHSQLLHAGYIEGKVDACAGDSGGGLVVQKLVREKDLKNGVIGRWRIAGIVSRGPSCHEPNLDKPKDAGKYMRVAFYLKWIKEKTGLV